MKTVLVLITGVLLAGCAEPRGRAAASALQASAELKNARGETVGTATLVEEAGGTRVVVEAKGLAPGRHGIHLHAVGQCVPPTFTSAGDHYNPLGKKHGLENPEGPHAGDLPNLEADSSGTARYTVVTERVTLREGRTSVFDGDGSALVIHERRDDQRTDPAGDSGDRVACGVIVKSPASRS